MRWIRGLSAGSILLLLFLIYSCRSTIDLVLDDPAFKDDMIQAALKGQEFTITPEDYSQIAALYLDENVDAQRAAVLLASQTDDKTMHRLVVRAAMEGVPDTARTAMDAMLEAPDLYRPILLSFLDSSDPSDRSGALRVIGELGGPDLVPLLISFFNDPDPMVRNQASLAVLAAADRMNEHLRAALYDDDPLTAAMAYRTLGRYGDANDAPVFIEAFESDNSGLRREAQLAALRLGEAGLPFLHIEMANPGNAYRSRLASMDVVQGLKSPTSLGALMSLLDDEDERIVLKSQSILGTYGAEAVPALSELYRISDEAVRIQAVRLLGEIGANEALPLLASALEDPSKDVVQAAFYVLESFGPAAVPALRGQLAQGGEKSTIDVLGLLMGQGDPWLYETEPDKPNTTALFLMIQKFDSTAIAEFMEAAKVSSLVAETVLSLKAAWEQADDFITMNTQIESGSDPYLGAWRQREAAAVAAREKLKESFDVLHDYFETRDASFLADSRRLREESRRLEAEAAEWKIRADSMDEAQRARGQSRLKEYREMRDYLVRVWEYVIPELEPLAEAVYTDRGLDPRILSQESALLD